MTFGDFTIDVFSVKDQGDTFLLNGSLSVPKNPSNIEFQAISRWMSKGNIPEPQYTEEELRRLALEDIEAQADEELRATDVLCLADVWSGLTPGNQSQIKEFRSSLRSLKSSVDDPGKAVFPEIPAVISGMVDTTMFLKRDPKQKDVQK